MQAAKEFDLKRAILVVNSFYLLTLLLDTWLMKAEFDATHVCNLERS